MKREMWGTLRTVAVDKAIVITLHSMEEASARAKKVGILAKKMLDDVATRIEVRLETDMSLARLFGLLPSQEDFARSSP
ncbi:hypothetical protein EVJ58_g3108 [Rhodofomes roseus]|uniref:Uncharacterized protein n=1 Tax=Rhodofomes roseus TaxID=34475 RepID=A0A4Y9YMR8_9APHY|nr:hypothetical protein EVJ58_g3108 [Rhodofomes roseus]